MPLVNGLSLLDLDCRYILRIGLTFPAQGLPPIFGLAEVPSCYRYLLYEYSPTAFKPATRDSLFRSLSDQTNNIELLHP